MPGRAQRLFALTAAVAASDDCCNDVCAQLRKDIDGHKVTCQDSYGKIDYDFSSFNPTCASETPGWVVRPDNPDDVSNAIKAARKFKTTFSVRGAGHSYTCNGFKKGSVHLDMRGWKEKIDKPGPDGKVRLRPGHTVEDVLQAVGEDFNVALGSCPTVGVMGYYLHGGSSPRTAFLGNTTIHHMEVVTADGETQDLHRDDLQGLEDDDGEAALFQAMTQAGSSFGVVTMLELKLKKLKSPTIAFLVPIINSFEQVQPALVSKKFIQSGLSKNYWFGLFQYATYLGPTWYLKVTLNGATHGNNLQASVMDDVPPADPDCVANLTGYIHNHLSNVKIDSKSILDLAGLMKLGSIGFNYIVATLLPSGQSAEMPPTEIRAWPKHADAGSVGRFVDLDFIGKQSASLNDFYKAHYPECWYDMGPIKSDKSSERVFMDLTCTSKDSVAALLKYAKNTKELQSNYLRYYNLPLKGEDPQAYWPNYAHLQKIKKKWDTDDFFAVPDGIFAGSGPHDDLEVTV